MYSYSGVHYKVAIIYNPIFCSHYSALDDVVLDYVVEVLTNLGDADESSFDVDQLCEMIAAYVPEFAQVDRCEIPVCTLAAVGVDFLICISDSRTGCTSNLYRQPYKLKLCTGCLSKLVEWKWFGFFRLLFLYCVPTK